MKDINGIIFRRERNVTGKVYEFTLGCLDWHMIFLKWERLVILFVSYDLKSPES